MSDYARANTGGATHFGDKDALTTGDADKVIVGAQFDTEFNAIVTANATKYDSDDLASVAQAEAETANTVLMTPLRVANWADANAGMVGDIQALADPNADQLLGWDDSAGAVVGFTAGTNLAFSGTTLTAPTATLEAAISHDNLVGFVADEHIAHSGVTVTAGTGLTGGGTIDSTITLNVAGGNGLTANANDIAITDAAVSTTVPVGFSSGALTYDPSSLTAFGTTAGADLDADYVILEDAGVSKYALTSQLVTPEIPAAVSGTTDTLAETDFGKVTLYSNAAITVTLPNGLKTGFWATLIYTGTGTLTLSATTTLNSANSLTACTQQYGAITVLHAGSNVWYAWGALDS